MKAVRVTTVILVVLFGLSTGGARGQGESVSPELETQLEQLEDVARQIRGLDELTPVIREFPTRGELQEYLVEQIDRQLDEETARIEVLFYVAFDLLPPDFDLRETYLDLLSAQVAGYYDPETKEMNVILLTGDEPGNRLPLLEQIAYIHEYVHALQDQHFGLREVGLDPEQLDVTGDSVLALQALVEGDATAVMYQYTRLVSERNPLGAMAEMLLGGAQAGVLTLPPETPPILGAELLFAYLEGQSFVVALWEEGGWELVNRAFSDPPTSTEQIMHPQRYLDGDEPLVVTLRSDTTLGDDWDVVLDRTMGEFYLGQYLRTQLPASEADAAAQGWGGDRYHIFYNAQTGQRAWVLKLVWDNAQEASEFVTNYVEFADARFGVASETEGSALCWSNASEALCMSAETDTTLLAAGPALDMAVGLIEAQQ